jgi:hypothetical protein
MMNRGIAAAFVPQTAPEPTGLAVHTHRRRQGWRRVATAAVATRRPGGLPVARRRWGRGSGPSAATSIMGGRICTHGKPEEHGSNRTCRRESMQRIEERHAPSKAIPRRTLGCIASVATNNSPQRRMIMATRLLFRDP